MKNAGGTGRSKSNVMVKSCACPVHSSSCRCCVGELVGDDGVGKTVGDSTCRVGEFVGTKVTGETVGEVVGEAVEGTGDMKLMVVGVTISLPRRKNGDLPPYS